MKKINNIIIFTILIIYLELLSQFFIYGSISNLVLKVLFSFELVLIIQLITSMFPEKINKIIISILVIGICIIYTIYFTYYKTFGSVISLYSITKGIEVAQFQASILDVIQSNWYAISLMLIPIAIYFIFSKIYSFEKVNTKWIIISICSFLVLYLTTTIIISLDKQEDIYSNKNLYFNINNLNENFKKFGLYTTVRLDVQRKIFGFNEKNLYKYEDTEGNTKILSVEEYNIEEIDFEKLIENETDEVIKEIHEYMKTEEPTKKNEYTGIFEGKNLIVVVGESFSSLGIDENITPTLYKLVNNSFVFENFYTPLFPVSTADGEYLTDTSLLPAENTWSIEKIAGNYIPYSYANILKKQGYKTFAFHNYKYDYYNRHKYFETMGYESYLAFGNGLEERMNYKLFPSSDYEMIKTTVNDYINEEKFLAYYITMSGHMDYDEGNSMVRKNWDLVKSLPYSDKCKGYLATQIEFDKAMEELINSLEQKGKLEDTVIVISGDHYPYGLTEDEIKELMPYDKNEYSFERFHMPLVIYNSQMPKTNIEKYGSSLDILPTVLNLFGAEYDSRLLIGKDILSDSNPFVIFSDRSFIIKNEKYNSISESLYRNNQLIEDYDYIKKVKQKIYLKYKYSRLILENDYYRKIFNPN